MLLGQKGLVPLRAQNKRILSPRPLPRKGQRVLKFPHTWWRSGAASSPDSSLPQRRQAAGFRGMTSSHCAEGRSGRSCLGWPG
jgi:hypothetical protein